LSAIIWPNSSTGTRKNASLKLDPGLYNGADWN
jgi:hypothetical protein